MGPAAKKFFSECLDLTQQERDIDFYHWSAQRFGDVWKTAFSVLMARERARVALAASQGDWSKRNQHMSTFEQDDVAEAVYDS